MDVAAVSAICACRWLVFSARHFSDVWASANVADMSVAPPPLEEDQIATETAVTRSRSTLWQRITSNRFLFISIAVHVIGALLATAWVVQSYTTNRKLTFKGGPPSPNRSTRAIEHKVQMAKKQSTMSAPAVKRIVSTGVSKVTLPEMPAMPKSAAQPSKMAGVGGATFSAATGPMGSGAPAGGSLVSMFGLRENTGGSLVGTFYDLKQDKAKKPTGMDEPKYEGVVNGFVKGSWSKSQLENYYAAPQKLFTPQIFIPNIDANEGPKAFNVGREVEPKWWLVHYEGKVIPNESGIFHFVGAGDDTLIVRFNGQTVLDGSYGGNSRLAKKEGLYSFGWPAEDKSVGFVKGDGFPVEAGKIYPIEVLIGESPGGKAHYLLMLEKQGQTYQKDGKGNPILPVFRLANVKPARGDFPRFAEDGPVWTAVRVDAGRPPSPLDALKKQ